MQALSQEKIAEFKQAFQLFDKDNDNYVDVLDLPLMIRSLYQNPTEKQLGEWAMIVDPDKKGRFQFADFLALMASKYKQPESEEQLIQAMRSIFNLKDKEKQGSQFASILTKKEFKNVMLNSGEKMTDQELNQLFKQLKMDSMESFNFEEFIKAILTR